MKPLAGCVILIYLKELTHKNCSFKNQLDITDGCVVLSHLKELTHKSHSFRNQSDNTGWLSDFDSLK